LGNPTTLVTTSKSRLDQLLVARGLAESREKAQALILAGDVVVEGFPNCKAGTRLPVDVEIRVAAPAHPWVSRGGIKLAYALDVFGLNPHGKLALDIGASTGGFTDVLLQRGARHVIAVDVGHGQLHWKLRSDSRVSLHEGVNARRLTRADLPELGNGADVVTIDVSFISLKHILPAVRDLLAIDGRVVSLVKPQFEAGRGDVGPGGIINDPAIHARVIDDVTAAAAEVALSRLDVIESPITGAEGNKEFLMLFALRSS
jgi:23S rRNA (cytidine1920-2'-O)/16S rRNA (cytidine1409-2'-O)-methyltransferase